MSDETFTPTISIVVGDPEAGEGQSKRPPQSVTARLRENPGDYPMPPATLAVFGEDDLVCLAHPAIFPELMQFSPDAARGLADLLRHAADAIEGKG